MKRCEVNYEDLSPMMQQVVEMNPVYIAIAILRDCVMEGTISTWDMWVKLIAWSVGCFSAGYGIFQAKENKVMTKM